MNQTLSCTSRSLPAYLLLLLRTVHYLCNIDKTLIPHPPPLPTLSFLYYPRRSDPLQLKLSIAFGCAAAAAAAQPE